jgi:hypothetical protein
MSIKTTENISASAARTPEDWENQKMPERDSDVICNNIR